MRSKRQRDEQLALASRRAADPGGREAVLKAAEEGRLDPRLLLRPDLVQKLGLDQDAARARRWEQLTARLPAEDERIDGQIADARGQFLAAGGSAEAGAAVFEKQCAACHRIAAVGQVVGPNLDGIGHRGLDRLLEDLLAPHRNVDPAFRSTTVVTQRGEALSGLLKENADGSQTLIDRNGQARMLAAAEIDETRPSRLSAMPDNLAESIDPGAMRDLLAFLLSQRQ